MDGGVSMGPFETFNSPAGGDTGSAPRELWVMMDRKWPEHINHMSQIVLYLHLIFTAAFRTFMFHLQLHLTAGLFSGFDMITKGCQGLDTLLWMISPSFFSETKLENVQKKQQQNDG